MGDRREDDLSAIAWPGFVDILSAVIIMFVFFVMIVATALYFHILIFTSKMRSNVSAVDVKTESQFEFAQIQTQFAESTEQNVTVDQETKSLVVFFGRDSISILPSIKEEAQKELGSFLQKGGADGYQINVYMPKFERKVGNAAREISVARMLNVRNTLMDVGFNPKHIQPKMVDAYDIDDKEHWIKIELIER